MLDQNTDRMWFVIGALVVGAGIILLANKAFPDMFDNITNVFANVVDNNKERIGMTRPYVNLINVEDANRVWSSTYSTRPEFVRTTDLAPIINDSNLEQRYKLVFDAKSSDTSQNKYMMVYMQNSQTSKYSMYKDDVEVVSRHNVILTEEWQTYTIDNVLFKPTATFNTDTEAYLSFYGNYETGNIPVIKNLQLYPVN